VRLCVGAVSRRVVEEAAKLKVAQIVASPAQVNINGGYTTMTPRQLVDMVWELSGGETKVVRDHGSDPRMLAGDIEVGFDGIHIDPSQMIEPNQLATVFHTLANYEADVFFEVGGEHTNNSINRSWFEEARKRLGSRVTTRVVNAGTYVWADHQTGSYDAFTVTREASQDHVVKLHNMDWLDWRALELDPLYMPAYYNIAPEFAVLELDAVLMQFNPPTVRAVLEQAYETGRWLRWFNEDEGTWLQRAKCALRYVINTEDFDWIGFDDESESDEWVRTVIRDAIRAA